MSHLQCLRNPRRGLSSRVYPLLKIRKFSASKIRDPLRILFCGSDDFSVCALQSLYQEHKQDRASIASIEVVCRPGKPVGRGLKTVRQGDEIKIYLPFVR